jgi:hypothetical protein
MSPESSPDKRFKRSGQILSAMPPGTDEPFFPISLLTKITAFAAHIAKIFNIFSPDLKIFE